MKKKQCYNPYLPLGEYVPDGEPHQFGDRIYIYGSHDKEGGETFCMLDYVTYSAPVDDLTDWRYEGVIYRANQDPQYGTKIPSMQLAGGNADTGTVKDTYRYMYAPDVVEGPDGRYYLYYSMSGDFGVGGYVGPISVAVADTPVGPYEFLGYVQNPDGSPMLRYVLFDPAVLNDNGVIRLYYGTQYDFEEQDDFTPDSGYVESEMGMFGRTKEEVLSYPDSIMGAITVTLKEDMLTIADEPRHIIPYKVKGTSFEGHPFFEGPSMRKVGEKYYFVYSSKQNHELCYAVSDWPDRDFIFGGSLVSNGDVGINGRELKDKLNMTGTTHGSIIEVNGEWYVFYHRLTHKSDYSRQACAEKIEILPDGSIRQVEITSCGLNGGPLDGKGEYPAVICCCLTNGKMPHGCNSICKDSFPNVTHRVVSEDLTERYVGEICDGTLIGYRYFDVKDLTAIRLTVALEMGEESASLPGYFEVRTEMDGPFLGQIPVEGAGADWGAFEGKVSIPDGVHALYLTYHGERKVRLLKLELI